MKIGFVFCLIVLSATFSMAKTKDKINKSSIRNYAVTDANQFSRNTNEDLDVEPFVRFWRKLDSYARYKAIDLQKTYQLRLQSDFPSGKISEGDISFSSNSAQPEIIELIKDFTSAVDTSNLLKTLALEKNNEKIIGTDLRLSYGEFDIELDLVLKTNSENAAEKTTARLKTLFAVTGSFLKDNPAEEFYKNARISAKQTQVQVRGKIAKDNFINYLRDF